jgi:putative flippase GtrA
MSSELKATLRHIENLGGDGTFGQLVRFGIAGGISSVIYIAVFMPLTMYVFEGPQAAFAVPFAFAVAVTAGFPLHSLWSFRGHGTRENSGKQHFKFVVVQGTGLLINLLLTWIVTDVMRLPPWVSLIPVLTLIPLVTFTINRNWVFG